MERPTSQSPLPASERLESWKEIARYLNRDVRTVQRWERTKGLPVRRLPGGEQARTYALKSELDAWWTSGGIRLVQAPEANPEVKSRGAHWLGRTSWPRIFLGAAAVLAVALIAAWRMSVVTSVSPLRAVPITSYSGEVLYPSFSPDGKQVVFTWNGEQHDNFDLYVKLIGEGQPLRLTRNPDWDSMGSWSPDGRQIAFARWRMGSSGVQILTMPALGGVERVLAEMPITEIWPVPASSWSHDGRYLLAGISESQTRTALFRTSVETGERKRITTPPEGWWGDDSPVLSPDGATVAFIRRRGPEEGNIYLLSLSGSYEAKGEPRQLTHETCCVGNPLWVGGGREVLYAKHETNITTLHRIAAKAGAQAKPVNVLGDTGSYLSISPQGDKLVYVSGATDSDLWQVELPKDVNGAPNALLEAKRVFSSSRVDAMPDFSPDGRCVAFSSNRSGTLEIWIADHQAARRVTSLGGPQALLPRWSPDGKEIVFFANVDRNRRVFTVAAEGGKPRQLTSGPGIDFVASWARDGRSVYFASDRTGAYQCWKVPAAGGEAAQITKGGCSGGMESVDGAYFYYAKTFNSGVIWQVPVNGGEERPVHPGVKAFSKPWMFAVTRTGIYTAVTENPLSGFRLQVYDFETGRTKIFGRIRKPLGRSMAVSPDDNTLLFQDYPARRGDLMILENFR
jgi:Tol biopolymer transport system component